MNKVAKFIAPSIVAALVAAFVVTSSQGSALAHNYVPTPSPTSTPTATPSSTPSPTPTITPTPSPTYKPTPTPTPSVTPTPTPSPTPTVSPTPTPSVTPTPTPSPTTTNENKQEQSQTQNNNQTVNITVQGQVLSGKAPVKQPETGVGVLGLATMFGSAPAGIILARFRKGRATSKDLTNSEFASNAFAERLQKQSDLS